MSPRDARFGPPEPPQQRAEPPGRTVPVWLHAVGALLWGPLGIVAALVLAVGAAALLARPSDRAVYSRAVEPAVPAVRPPAPADGAAASLWVASEPSGAVVEVRGDSVGVTPTWVRGIRPGAASVAVRLGGLVLDSVVVLRPAGDRDLAFRFDPGLVAAADRAARRSAASEAPELSPDRTDVEADEASPPPPSPPASRPVAARPDPRRPPETSPRSTPRPDSPARPAERRGTVEIAVPAGSAIMINGRVVMRNSGARYRTSLPVGSHQVRVVYPSTDDEETDIYVGGGVTTMVTFGPDPGAAGTWE
ncbi:hypothetical protein [Rubrivirga sp.]|uniref:hypothetical protein n=1 Tax=Rubrivirga sp. TaxID=1885344 RepID=UPI003B51B047